MKKFRIGLIAFIFSLLHMTALANVVTVTGQGASERDALHNAMRAAIEQEIGVLVDSRTYVENYRVISDKIYTHTEGYIAGYDVIDQNYFNGIYSITIRANVKRDILNADLMTSIQKKAMIRANMQDPRIGVLIMDSRGGENEALENKIITGLSNNGFSRIVDLTQINDSVRRRIANAVFDGDEGLSHMLRSQFNVDYLVSGRMNMSSGGIPIVPDFPFIGSIANVVVNISVRMMNVNTGEIVYAGSFDGQSFNIGAKAEQDAIKKASKDIVKELMRSALKKAASPEQHVTILITNGALGSMGEAYARISQIPGVSNVYTRSASGGNMQMDVDYGGTAYDFAQALERDGITIREMNSEYIKI